MSKADQYKKALAAASSAPLRRKLVAAPALREGDEPRFIPEWRSGFLGKLNKPACEDLVSDGMIAPSEGDPDAYFLTEKGERSLRIARNVERAWLA